MSDFTIPPPAEGDYAPQARGYVDSVRDAADIRALLRVQPELLRGALQTLTDREALGPYAPGKWSVNQVVGHLSDSERVFAYRLLRISRGDQTPLAGFEQDDLVRGGRFDDRPLAQLAAEFDTGRAATLALLDGLDAAALERRGTASDAAVSARALVYIIAGHVHHHLHVLHERYGVRR